MIALDELLLGQIDEFTGLEEVKTFNVTGGAISLEKC
jgi:hypothetical protein